MFGFRVYVCQVRWGDVTGMVVCSVSPAHVIGTFPYVLMVPDDQTGPELQLASFIIGKKCKAADILPTTVSEEYALAVSALCSDDLMRSVIRRINTDPASANLFQQWRQRTRHELNMTLLRALSKQNFLCFFAVLQVHAFFCANL